MFTIVGSLLFWVGLPLTALAWAISGSAVFGLIIGGVSALLVLTKALRLRTYFQKRLGTLTPAEKWQKKWVDEVADQMAQTARQLNQETRLPALTSSLQVVNFQARGPWIIPLPRVLGRAPRLLVSQGFWTSHEAPHLAQALGRALLTLQSPDLLRRCVAAVLADWTSLGMSGVLVRSFVASSSPCLPVMKGTETTPGQWLVDWLLSPILTHFLGFAARSLRPAGSETREDLLFFSFRTNPTDSTFFASFEQTESLPLCAQALLCATHALPSAKERVI
jgi:hypothetical protein